MNTHADVDVGSDFLGYRIEKLIGRGGMGVVYRAHDLRLKRTVALKLVSPELTADDRFRNRFARESEMAMSLEHPNVVPIHDAGDGDGRLYLVMRLVEGTDLRELLRAEGALNQRRSLDICRQVANALDAAHATGLVHRDVKPSNVLLDRDEHVYLADFGLTRRLEDPGVQAVDGRSVGTPAYLAPEQVEGRAVDGRVDVYSLGCLLFECLTGEVPFARSSQLAVAWAHLEEEPPRASTRDADVPAEMDFVIRKAMAKRADDRYTTCGALVDDAERAMGFRKPSRARPKAHALIAAALVLVLGAVLGVILLPRKGDGADASKVFADANTLARVDPATGRVVKVIATGRTPAAVAAAGHSVWVYNDRDRSVSEVDTATSDARTTTPLSAWPRDLGPFAGPVIAADAAGAWVIGLRRDGTAVLTRLLRGGGRREYRLGLVPRGVAVGYGAVWIVGRSAGDNQLLRLDPKTGRIAARTSFPGSAIDSLALGYDALWVVGSSGTLYRIDPRSSAITGEVVVGRRAARPEPVFGSVLIRRAVDRRKTVTVSPRAMTIVDEADCCSPEWGGGWLAPHSRWLYDWPTGSVLRQDSIAGTLRSIRIVKAAPVADGPCLTGVAFAAGDVWVSVAPSVNHSCPRSKVVAAPFQGGRVGARQGVVITSTEGIFRFTLSPHRADVLRRDSGLVSWGAMTERWITRDGLRVEVDDIDATFLGKRGNLTVHLRNEWFDAGNGDFINDGTWRVVRGTLAYSGVTGSGRVAATWLPSGPRSFRLEGFVYAK